MWIAHLSDPHVRPRGVLYQGVVDANASLANTVDAINKLDPPVSLVLLTGDVVEEGAPVEYDAARVILAELRAPLLVIPGNHDERHAFRLAFGDHPHLPAQGPLHFAVNAGPVRIVAVDVTEPGLHHGLFDEDCADWLERALATAPDQPTLLLMHQPPLTCGVPYLDKYRCFGANRLSSIIARFPQVERVLCGHVHRHMLARIAGTLLCTAPSTATTIALQPRPDAAPASFVGPPAFLLHEWRSDGFLTHFVPIGTYPGPFPFA